MISIKMAPPIRPNSHLGVSQETIMVGDYTPMKGLRLHVRMHPLAFVSVLLPAAGFPGSLASIFSVRGLMLRRGGFSASVMYLLPNPYLALSAKLNVNGDTADGQFAPPPQALHSL